MTGWSSLVIFGEIQVPAKAPSRPPSNVAISLTASFPRSSHTLTRYRYFFPGRMRPESPGVYEARGSFPFPLSKTRLAKASSSAISSRAHASFFPSASSTRQEKVRFSRQMPIGFIRSLTRRSVILIALFSYLQPCFLANRASFAYRSFRIRWESTSR